MAYVHYVNSATVRYWVVQEEGGCDAGDNVRKLLVAVTKGDIARTAPPVLMKAWAAYKEAEPDKFKAGRMLYLLAAHT
jgi:hypothetical protein